MFNKTISLGLLFLPLALSACLSQSNVQANYVAQQRLCQEASRVAAQDAVDGVENAPISVSQFAKCMRQAGWNVAMPKAPAPAQPAAAQPVQQQPQQQPVAAPQAQPVAPQEQAPPMAQQQSPAPVAATHKRSHHPARRSINPLVPRVRPMCIMVAVPEGSFRVTSKSLASLSVL